MRPSLALVSLLALTGTAAAQTYPPSPPPMPPPSDQPPPPVSTVEQPEEPPGQGDFDAGGKVRLPNGPDEMGQFATFNWVAVDVQGTYYLLDSVTVRGNVPLAVIKPDMLVDGSDPRMFGGVTMTFDAMMPANPFTPPEQKNGVSLTAAYMREGAMLLSEKDYPLFVGDLKPGFATGVHTNMKLGSLLDFRFNPHFFYQQGTAEAINGTQIPLSLVVGVGDLLKVSADAGIYTGDDFTFKASKGGRIAAGGSVTFKIGPIVTHAGAGVASLITGGAYPTIKDSVYIDLNVKYAK